MKPQAIALCRVSTPDQKLSNSLNRQEESVDNAAKELDVEIIKYWSGDVSSKVGRNVTRKDLVEAYEFCKANRRVKYFLVDEVDRFMRSVAEMFYWIVEFQQIGVRVYFAANPELNSDDSRARLLLSLDGFKAEGSNEERQRKSVTGHEKAIREGRHTFPVKPGYMKSSEPGIKVRHPITFIPLQNAYKEVVGGLYAPLEALKRLNESDFNKIHARWDMDKFRHFGTDPYYAGILDVNKQVRGRNEYGLHEAMLTLEEHEQLTQIFTGRYKPRGPKNQYNPEFPMNKIMICQDCGAGVKFTGSNTHSGDRRKTKNGYKPRTKRYYPRYRCRGCGRSYARDEVHSLITQQLIKVQYTGSQQTEFVQALEAVWRQKQQDKLHEAKGFQSRLNKLQEIKSSLVIEFAKADPNLKEDLKIEVEKTKTAIVDIENRIKLLSDLDKDLVEFAKFGLEYTNKLSEDWWLLDHENRVRCQQLLFPGGISFNSQRKVGTAQISPLYTLESNKKDLSKVEKSLLVELPVIATGSDVLLS